MPNKMGNKIVDELYNINGFTFRKYIDGKHYNLHDILPFQRKWNLICGPRTIGKSVTFIACKFLLDFIKKGWQTVFYYRTADEIRCTADFLLDAREIFFPNMQVEIVADKMMGYIYIYDDDGNKHLFGYNLCLKYDEKYKKFSGVFKHVNNICMDEFLLLKKQNYIKNEWLCIKSIFDTIDRGSNRCKFYGFANMASIVNPIFNGLNVYPVLAQEYTVTKDVIIHTPTYIKYPAILNDTTDQSAYGKYARGEAFILDNNVNIGKMNTQNKSWRGLYTMHLGGAYLGIFQHDFNDLLYIKKIKKPLKNKLAFTDNPDFTIYGFQLAHMNRVYFMRLLSNNKIFFDSLLTKSIFHNFLNLY